MEWPYKVYCHTDIYMSDLPEEKRTLFSKGKYYDIVPDDNSYIIPTSGLRPLGNNILRKSSISYIFLKCDKDFNVSFRLIDEFDNYFYTFKQMRKKKLEKLELYEK